MPGFNRKRRIRQLVKAQKGMCPLCHRQLVWWKANLDHVIPKSAGGTYAIGNVLAVHVECNTRRGNTAPTQEQLAAAREIADRRGLVYAYSARG